MRRLLSVAGLVLVLTLSTAAPALAAEEVRFISPPTPKTGATVQGGQQIKVQASVPGLLTPGEVDSITVTIKPRPGFKAGSPVSATQQGGDFTMAWDTRSSTPYNGGYDIEATAKTPSGLLAGAQTFTSVLENVIVNNPPSSPSGVKAGVEGTAGVVRWSANPEPDITSYKVSRSVDGGGFSHLASVDSAKSLVYTDSQAPAGKKVRYQVAAIRRSAVSDGGLVSEPSESSEISIPGADTQQPGQVPGQPATDASGQPIPEPAQMAAPLPSPTMASTLPINKKAPPPPIYKSRPSEIAFAPTLPFSEAPPPQRFDTAGEGTDEDLAAPSGLTDRFTATNPTWFIVIGAVLLGVSVFFARTSRKILKSTGEPLFRDDFLADADFSSLGQIELPVVEVAYPTFKVFDGGSGEPAPFFDDEEEPSTGAAFGSVGRIEPPPEEADYPTFKVAKG